MQIVYLFIYIYIQKLKFLKTKAFTPTKNHIMNIIIMLKIFFTLNVPQIALDLLSYRKRFIKKAGLKRF